MAQRWNDLLFAHWPVDKTIIQAMLPPGLTVDAFQGQAWISVVPFRMSGVRPRFVPPLPWLSAFPELNVRTYVVAGGKPGVWFFSLDAGNPIAVALARRFFHLPYFRGTMTCQGHGDRVDYFCQRTHAGAPPARFVASYGPAGAVASAEPGSLNQWLVERYCLYAADRQGRLYRGEIHHAPWPIQPAWAEIEENSMLRAAGISLPVSQPLLHFARRLDVVVWPLRRLPKAPIA
jgi:hypothetical protein